MSWNCEGTSQSIQSFCILFWSPDLAIGTMQCKKRSMAKIIPQNHGRISNCIGLWPNLRPGIMQHGVTPPTSIRRISAVTRPCLPLRAWESPLAVPIEVKDLDILSYRRWGDWGTPKLSEKIGRFEFKLQLRLPEMMSSNIGLI